MDAQELRSLQEAYNQVHQLDEVLDTPERANEYARKNLRSMLGAFAKGVVNKDMSQLKTIKKRGEGAKMAKRKAERKAAEEQKEQVDLYDIILTHLLDEGYAETEDAAQAIMVNMSEDWRESIVEEVFDEALTGERYKKAVKKPGGTAYSRMVSPDPAKRATRGGRGGESDFGAGDRGSGNKAARRAGTYKDKED
jgi:hypothetical protein